MEMLASLRSRSQHEAAAEASLRSSLIYQHVKSLLQSSGSNFDEVLGITEHSVRFAVPRLLAPKSIPQSTPDILSSR
jgi:hypothetical protein